MFNNALGATRKFWTPQTGRGAQHSALGAYKIIAKTITKICNKLEDELIIEDGDIVCEEGYSKYMLEHNRKQWSE